MTLCPPLCEQQNEPDGTDWGSVQITTPPQHSGSQKTGSARTGWLSMKSWTNLSVQQAVSIAYYRYTMIHVWYNVFVWYTVSIPSVIVVYLNHLWVFLLLQIHHACHVKALNLLSAIYQQNVHKKDIFMRTYDEWLSSSPTLRPQLLPVLPSQVSSLPIS